MLFLGVFDTTGLAPSPADLEQLRRAVSRQPEDRIVVTARAGFAVATVSDPVFGKAVSWRDDAGMTGMVLGRAYLESETDKDTDALLRCLLDEDTERLARSRGSFCAWLHDQRSDTIRFCTDKVGVYPVYLARVGSRVYFASALRMLKGLSGVCRDLDTDALVTALAFGFPLNTRTVFSNIERMYGGEVVSYSRAAPTARRVRYWSWDRVPSQQHVTGDLEQRVYDAFLDAVGIRLEDTPGDLSFLSGGLDSRCIVGALAALGRTTWTLNFAPEGSQDHLFGRLVAEALGAHHHELGLNHGSFPERQRAILDSWAASHPSEVGKGANPYRVWSGDGGSVGLGHVYLDAEFVRLLREDRLEAACRHFMESGKKVVPTGMLRSRHRVRARTVPLKQMMEEVASFACEDPARAGFLFLLLNDQRLHLTEYFENVDLHRFELVLPFFDAHLLELVVSASVDPFLGHHFYNDWLHRFPPGVASVPWQAYPGHAPCPVSSDQYGSLRYQWKEDWFDEAESLKRRQSAEAAWRRMLDGDALPDAVANKALLRVALWLTNRKIRDYGYVLNSAQQLASFTSLNR